MQIKISSVHCFHHSCLFGLIKNRFFFPVVLCSGKLRVLFSSYCQEVAWTWSLPILKSGAISSRNSRWEFNFSFFPTLLSLFTLQCSLESTQNESPHSFPVTYRRVGNLSKLLQRAQWKRSTFEWITVGKKIAVCENFCLTVYDLKIIRYLCYFLRHSFSSN